MQYKYEKIDADYSDLASGRVLYSASAHPAFPTRLASEIFQRCMAHRETIYQTSTPCTLYDPCCGAAYHLSVLGFLQGKRIQEIIGSDIDGKAVDLAKRNLGLLTVLGLDKRIEEINKMIEQYSKDSHREALKSALVLRNKIAPQTPPRIKVFQANAVDRQTILNNIEAHSIDILFTDVPYGQHSQWQSSLPNPLWSTLDALTSILSSSSIVAIVSDKGQKVSHESYRRLEQFQVGKRRVVILNPV